MFTLNNIPLLCAGLVAVLASPTAAQPGTEIVFGGGFHFPVDGRDTPEIPKAPTVDVRIVRWTSDRWGVSGRAVMGFGSRGPVDSSFTLERHDPMYFQGFVRYRIEAPANTTTQLGLGGGILLARRVGTPLEEQKSFDRFLNLWTLEVLNEIPLTERLGVKVGIAAAIYPMHLHPVALFAWRL